MAEALKTENKTLQKVILKERFEIDFNAPLPKLNANNALAYEVKDVLDSQRKLFALIANNDTPPRLSLLPMLKTIEEDSVLNFIDFGIVDFLPQKTQNMALIYEQPHSLTKFTDLTHDNVKMLFDNKEKLSAVISSLLLAIETLNSQGISHRAIRPDNIFINTETLGNVVIGDCVACFPGFLQPSVYETIEMSVCSSSAKGDGSSVNDFYSLAVCLLFIFADKEAFINLNEFQILESKITQGSFSAISKDVEAPKWLLPLLRGLLDDSASTRWRYMQSYNYVQDKNSVSIKQSIEKTKRAFVIDKIKYYYPKEVVYVLLKNTEKAVETVTSEKFAEWLKLGFDRENVFKDFNILLSQERNPEILVSKTCILIAPEMPISYKGLSFFPKGLPKGIFYAQQTSSPDVNLYKEIISLDILNYWFISQPSGKPLGSITEFSAYLNNKEYGYGLERIIYNFDEDLPCRSPLFKGCFVNNVGGVLRCLDKNVNADDEYVYDNSIISYLRCKMDKNLDGFLKEINSHKEEQRILGILKLYSYLQIKFGPQKLINLTEAMAVFCTPLIKRYKNLKTQKEVEESLLKSAKSGVMQKVYDVLQNNSGLTQDNEKYTQAVSKHVVLSAEHKNILLQKEEGSSLYADFSKRMSTTVAIIVMIISFVASAIIHFG